ncbi:hypothetical protein SAMN06298226_0642 [Nitrosovibrio sp. Nv4]|nr:hypothetical protein SAMN06298226_0642 [Nitrosovibrio sp. Nv4]
MHIDYFVKGKSMLYGDPGVKRDYGLILLLTNKTFSEWHKSSRPGFNESSTGRNGA